MGWSLGGGGSGDGPSDNGVTTETYSGVAAADIELSSAAKQEINFRFIPATDDVELYLRLSFDGDTYDATGYEYVGATNSGIAIAPYGSTSAAQVVLQEDNAAPTAGIGSGASEGVSGRIVITRLGAPSGDFCSLLWDLEYRNAAAGAMRKVSGSGGRKLAATALKVRLFFEGSALFSGEASLRDCA